MRKMMMLAASVFVIGSAVFYTAHTDGHASSNGAPAYETGSPGDGGTCTDCHSGTAATGGTITSNIPVSGYVAGTTYNFTVSISGSSSNNYGFEVACENTAGAFLGTLSAPGTGAKLISSSHFVTQTTPGTGTSKSWTFSWTAPSTSPPSTVTFYAAFLVGNNNGSTSGDATKTTSKTYSLSAPCAMTSTLTSQTNVTCNGGSDGAASVSASGGTGSLTYSWVPSGGTSASAVGLAPGSYTCTIKDANSCTSTKTLSITQPTAVTPTLASKTNITCNGSSNGAATVSATGGTAPYTYAWAPSGGSSATASGLAAGTFTCTITDAHGCAKTQTVSLTQPAAIVSSIASQTNITSCTVTANGAASVSASGGTSPYTYNWSPSGGTAATATGLSAGTYTCTITDASSCTKAQVVTITSPTNNISASISSQTNVSCNGLSNGAATISASGGSGSLTYSWSPSGGSSASASGLTAGAYTCTIKDANNCSKTQTISITQPSILAATPSQTNISCGSGSGQAQVSVSGGTSPYTYNWVPSGGTAATASGLAANNYTCTITDAHSCTKTQLFTITSSTTGLSVSINSSANTTCSGQGVTLTGNGATSYTWSTGATTGSIVVAPSTTTSYTLTGSNGCTGTAVTTITVNPLPTITASSSTPTLCAGQSVTLTASGATTYTWSTADTGPSIVVSPMATTTYTVAGTSSGCNNVTVITQPVAICTGIDELAAEAADVQLYPNPNNGQFTMMLHNKAQVILTDLLGNVVMNETLQSGSHVFDLPGISKGVYFVKVMEMDGGQHSFRMIRE